MASMRKSYFLSPSWTLDPTEVALGSVIANINRPDDALSAEPFPIDTSIYTGRETSCSGTIVMSKKQSVGLFATFIQVIKVGGGFSYSSTSTAEVAYSCESVETRRFTPSTTYITKAAGNDAVKRYLKIGGLGAKVFVISGIKTAHGVTITTTQGSEQATNVHTGIEIPATQLTLGPRVTYMPKTSETHTRTIAGPIVFAFEVEKLRVNRKGQATSKEFVDGAMLGQKDDVEYVVERAGNYLDEDEMEDFVVAARLGVEDENGEECQIIFPSVDE